MDTRILSTLIAYVAMLVIFQVLTRVKIFKDRLAVPISMIIAALIAGLIGGRGLPLYRAYEGTFGFFYFAVVFVSGVVLVSVMNEIGFNESIKRFLVTRLKYRAPIFIGLMLLLMIPGMLTGLGVVGIASIGGLAAVVLMEMGMPKTWTAVFIMVGAMLGMVAPPVNLPLMIIGSIVAMPYRGFTPILLVMTIPLAVIFSLVLGYACTNKEAVEKMHAKEQDAKETAKKASAENLKNGGPKQRHGFWVYPPLLVVIVLLILERTIPNYITLSVPLVLMIGALTALPMMGLKKFFTVARNALTGQTLMVLALLLVAGFQTEVLAMIGVKGLTGSFLFGIVPKWMFYGLLFVLPWLGGFSTAFGVATFLGFPFVLALLPKNALITAAAFSLILAVSDIFPPTALSGNMAHQLVGADGLAYPKILRRACIPGAAMVVVGIVVILLSEPLTRLFV